MHNLATGTPLYVKSSKKSSISFVTFSLHSCANRLVWLGSFILVLSLPSSDRITYLLPLISVLCVVFVCVSSLTTSSSQLIIRLDRCVAPFFCRLPVSSLGSLPNHKWPVIRKRSLWCVGWLIVQILLVIYFGSTLLYRHCYSLSEKAVKVHECYIRNGTHKIKLCYGRWRY